MNSALSSDPAAKAIFLLSRLSLAPEASAPDQASWLDDISGELPQLVELAAKHHVVLRALDPLCMMLARAEKNGSAEWLAQHLDVERARIAAALGFLDELCHTLAAEGCRFTVMKSLDHWPDLGSDLDLFTFAPAETIVRIMTQCFHAEVEPRSWGDRMANKWNFAVPGVPTLIEVHIGRLGQTGEHVELSRQLISRAGSRQVGSYRFPVPAPEHQVVLATLQRMYRHFYLRLCDILNTAELVNHRSLDFAALESCARPAGIWPGVATYLCIVSDYVESFTSRELRLPDAVYSAARLRGDSIYVGRDFLRVPLIAASLPLFAAEMSTFVQHCDLPGILRLSSLPCLATAAALGQKFTGSDKGIW
jgi:hypothetical protein